MKNDNGKYLETGSKVNAISWSDDHVKMLDQRLLPLQEVYVSCQSSAEVSGAIRDMVIRGAPAIGIAAAYGVVLATREAYANDGGDWRIAIEPLLQQLSLSRPTAVSLSWAIKRMCGIFAQLEGDPEPMLLNEARNIHEEDILANQHMGELGADIIGKTDAILTHCNAGSLATGGYGTALGVIRTVHGRNNLETIYACETRPWMQGARLTVWELNKDGIPVTLITDNAASSIMRDGNVRWVVVGADRIAANGDVVNKIGTYSHAITARHHRIRLMVVAPTSTIDISLSSGTEIPIEHRSGEELFNYQHDSVGPATVEIRNPVFDITPAQLIDVLVTEKGAIRQPDKQQIESLMDVIST